MALHDLVLSLLVGNSVPVSEATSGVEKVRVEIAPAYQFQRDDGTVSWPVIVPYTTDTGTLTITGLAELDSDGNKVIWQIRPVFLGRGDQVVGGGVASTFLIPDGAATTLDYPADVTPTQIVEPPEYGPTWAAQAEASKVAAEAAAASAEAAVSGVPTQVDALVPAAVAQALTDAGNTTIVTNAVNAVIAQGGISKSRGGRLPAGYEDYYGGPMSVDGRIRWSGWRKDGGIPKAVAEDHIGVRTALSARFLEGSMWKGSGTVIRGRLRNGRMFGETSGSPKQARFFAIGGQSNAVGKADDSNIYLDPPHPRVFMADATGQLVPAADPIITADPIARKGFVFEFGRLMAEKYPNDDIVLVSYALGGTGFYHPDATPAQRWDPNAGGNLYNAWLNKLGLARAAAQAKYQTVIIDGIIWHQIEADRSHTELEYTSMLDPLIDGVRTFLGDSTIPFIVGAPAPEYVDTWTARTALYGLINTPARKTRTAYATAQYGWVGPDGIHYNRAGYDRLARSYRDAYTRAIRNVTGQVPELVLALSARRVGTDVLVAWEAPVGRIESYLIDWNPSATATDASSGWVTTGVTQATTLDVNARITGPVASPVGGAITVRVRVVNSAGTSLSNFFVV